MSGTRACDRCLARPWLLTRLGGHLEPVRGRIQEILALDNDELVGAVAGADRASVISDWQEFDPTAARACAEMKGLELVCRCDGAYPDALERLSAPPAVLHVAGGMRRFLDLAAREPVAIVGSRRPSDYGVAVATSLGRGLAAAGVPVLSGMANGIDSAAHAAALSVGGPTIAVLPGSADRAYPAGKRQLHRRIVAEGAAISELAPGANMWRWQFPARNRIVAVLSVMTVVVEAGERSGALLTARLARAASRRIGAVPGRVTSPQAAGPNGLLAHGAAVIRSADDVVDQLWDGRERIAIDTRTPLSDELRGLLSAIADGARPEEAFARLGISAKDGLAAVASLELSGYLRRTSGGRFAVVP